MHTDLQKQLQSNKENETKKLYDKIYKKVQKKEAANEILNELYINYKKDFNAKQYNEEEFCAFASFLLEMMENEENKFNNMVDDLSKSHIYTIKVYIYRNKDIYRTIKIPSIYRISDFVHCVLAAFDLITLEPYIAEYKDAKFYCKQLFDEMKEDIEDNEFSANDMPLEFLELSKGKKLCIDYALGSWIIECEVLSSTRNKAEMDEPVLVNGNGNIIPFDDMEVTQFMLAKEYKFLEDMDYSQEEIDNMKKHLAKEFDIEEIKENFEASLCVLSEFYENDIDDEELEFLDERAKRNIELDEKDHIKTYNEAKKIFENLIPVLVKEFEKNKSKYLNDASKIFENRLKLAIDEKHKFSNFNMQIEGKDVDNIFSCYMFPIVEGYESVAQFLLKMNKIKKIEEIRMLEAAINSKVGLYKITYNNINDALINVLDIKTNETTTIVDKNLSFGLETYVGQLYICGRIVEYNKVNFMSNAIILIEDKDVKQLIRDVKNNSNYTSIDYFQRSLIIQNKQRDKYL